MFFKENALLDVIKCAMICMMSVLMVGTWFDAAFVTRKSEVVACSAEINNMARNLNVTLLGECEVTR